MNHVLEHDAFVFAMNCVGTFDAAIERRRILVGMKNADVVVVADLAGFGVAGRRALIALAHERNQVIVELHHDHLSIEQVLVERRPIVE